MREYIAIIEIRSCSDCTNLMWLIYQEIWCFSNRQTNCTLPVAFLRVVEYGTIDRLVLMSDGREQSALNKQTNSS